MRSLLADKCGKNTSGKWRIRRVELREREKEHNKIIYIFFKAFNLLELNITRVNSVKSTSNPHNAQPTGPYTVLTATSRGLYRIYAVELVWTTSCRKTTSKHKQCNPFDTHTQNAALHPATVAAIRRRVKSLRKCVRKRMHSNHSRRVLNSPFIRQPACPNKPPLPPPNAALC